MKKLLISLGLLTLILLAVEGVTIVATRNIENGIIPAAECSWCGNVPCFNSSVCLSDCVCISDGVSAGYCASVK